MSGELEEAVEIVREILEDVVDAVGVEASIEVAEVDGVVTGRIDGEDVALLIGRHGQTIDALQHIAFRAALQQDALEREQRVVIDVQGYRARRSEALAVQADEAAEAALGSGGPVALEPMSASERREVHERLRERGDVDTHSEGEEPERRLVVSPRSP
jgi:spoIIIJ-associated protein